MTPENTMRETDPARDAARITLRRADRRDRERLRALYEEAFPPEERAPFKRLVRRARGGRADFWSLYDGDEWAGMAYVLTRADLAYVFYLAVDAGRRDRGAGSGAIAALRDRYPGRRMFVGLERPDPEAENSEQRERRRAFYARCGMEELPYTLIEVGVEFMMMGFGGPVEPEEYRAMADAWLGWPLRRFIDMRIVKGQGDDPDGRIPGGESSGREQGR